MATCLIECTPALSKRVDSLSAASLQPPKAMMPTEMSEKPGPSSSRPLATIMEHETPSDHAKILNRAIKRPSSVWKHRHHSREEPMPEMIQSMTTQLSTTNIISKPSQPFKFPNDPSDILLHQLTLICQKSADALMRNKSQKTIAMNIHESDKASSTLKSTRLANHFISCFVVGGEIRLCAPQIYSIIMGDVHEGDLSHCIRQFNVIDQMASESQLVSLKHNRAIPPEAGTCGLITKTNAERLVGALVDPVNYRTLPDEKKLKFEPLLVQHECFGGCEGRLYTPLYPGPCVECVECTCLMTTESFCRHSHVIASDSENLTHWGFDAANWPKYIRLHELAEGEEEYAQRFFWFLQNYSSQTEEEAEEELEPVKKPMISAPLSVLAAQLLAQQQSQGSGTSTSSAPSSFVPTSGIQANPLTSNPPTNPIQNLLSVLQAQSIFHPTSNLPLSEPTMAMLRAALHQPPNALPAAAASINTIMSYVHQHQQQQLSALNNLRNTAAMGVPTSMSDESEIPRKRAHTIADPSEAMKPKQDAISLSTISFGLLPADQQLMALLSHQMDADTLRRVTEFINASIAQRVQPIVDENAKLRKENAALREELQAKNDMLTRVANFRQHQLQSSLQALIPSASLNSMAPGASATNNNESDIEIDDN